MIIHICKIHGALEPENFIKKGKNTSGSQAYRCKFCMKDLHAKNYLKNKDKINEKNRLWRQKNKELMKEVRNEYYHATKHLNVNIKCKKRRDVKINRKQVENLSDRYIKHLLTKHGKFTSDQITPRLMEEKRNNLIEKRQRKEKEHE